MHVRVFARVTKF
ncbi:hypothetical protein, partial [Klebsiella phage vB_KpnM_TU02]